MPVANTQPGVGFQRSIAVSGVPPGLNYVGPWMVVGLQEVSHKPLRRGHCV